MAEPEAEAQLFPSVPGILVQTSENLNLDAFQVPGSRYKAGS